MADPAKFAALSAGQAVAVAHVAAHDLGAAAYAIRAAGACVPADDAAQARAKCRDSAKIDQPELWSRSSERLDIGRRWDPTARPAAGLILVLGRVRGP
jgi:hypothetical protein